MPCPSTYPLSPVLGRCRRSPSVTAAHEEHGEQETRAEERTSGTEARRRLVLVVGATGGERGAAVGERDQVTGRLGVADADQPLVRRR